MPHPVIRMIRTLPPLAAVLKLDSALCIAIGAALIATARPLAPLLSPLSHPLAGLPLSTLLALLGASLMAYGIGLYLVAIRHPVPPVAVWTIMAVNLLWVADCMLLLVMGHSSITLLGLDLVVTGAIAALALTVLEFLGLKQQARQAEMGHH